MPSSLGKTWYMNNQLNKIYRLDGFGYDWETSDKKLLLRDIDNGQRWVISASDLHKEILIDSKPCKVWEEMPDGWHPIGQETPYPGYTNDPRKDTIYGFNEVPQRHSNRRPIVDNGYRKRNGFR